MKENGDEQKEMEKEAPTRDVENTIPCEKPAEDEKIAQLEEEIELRVVSINLENRLIDFKPL